MANNNFLKGLWSDSRPHKQPVGTYYFGKNGIQYHSTGSVKNEFGFAISEAVLPGVPLGFIETDSKPVVFTTDGTYSHIGFFNPLTDGYENILNDTTWAEEDRLNFQIYNYITGEAQRNYKNEIIVAWTDKSETPKIMNTANPNAEKASDINMFPQSTAPTLDVTVTGGGGLLRGAYFVAVKYLNIDGTSTGYVIISPQNIVSTSGVNPTTDKALTITLNDLDEDFDQFQIAIISRINGVYTAVELLPQSLSPDSLTTVTYTGQEITTNISLEEVLIPGPIYIRVGTMGQLSDSIYIAELEKDPEPDLQMYVNKVKLRVKSELIDATPPPDEHVTGKTRSLMHQEVYAVYMRFKYANKPGFTKAFTIPGNSPEGDDMDIGSHVHETDLNLREFVTRDTNRNMDVATKTVDTGVWVNESEEYPDLPSFDSTSIGGEDLKETEVRHHKMPSIAWCKENFYPGEVEYGRTKLDILSLEVTGLSLPLDIQEQYSGYELLIAKRTIGNSTIAGQSLLLASALSINSAINDIDLGLHSTGGNWHSLAYDESLSPAIPVKSVLTGRVPTYGSTNPINAPGMPTLRFRFHAFDVLFNKPSFIPTYMSAQLKMRRDMGTEDYPVGGYIENGQLPDDGDGNKYGVSIIIIIDYTKGIPPVVTDEDQRTRAVEDTRYLPANASTGKWDNRDLEATFVGNIKWIGDDNDVDDNDLPLAVDTSYPRLDAGQSGAEKVQWEETYLVNLIMYKANVYNAFYAQTVLPSGQIKAFDSTESSYVGDVFINDYSFHTYGWLNSDNICPDLNGADPKNCGYKIVRRFVCEAASNINLRYNVEGNIYSQWWPDTPLVAEPLPFTAGTDQYMYQMVRTIDPNQFGYSKDLNTLNEVSAITPYNPFFEDQTLFPHRVHRGGKLIRTDKNRSWKTFLPLDFHESKKDRGRIIRVLGKDDRLLIHHEHALLQTRDRTTLESDLLNITLGSGDIFELEPEETIGTKLGYAGTQHELGAVDTPIGYFFQDASQGQVFVYNKQGLSLVNNGLSQFFQEQLKTVMGKNPYQGDGITVGYDAEYRRLLMTVKNRTLVEDLGELIYVPNYEETEEFMATLTPDVSIVYRHGKYVVFLTSIPGGDEFCGNCVDPEFDDDEVTASAIDENSPNGTLAYTISVLTPDPDTFKNSVTNYFIVSGNTAGAFAVNSSGAITVANSGALNYEEQTEWVLVITAVTNCGRTNNIEVTIPINDINEPPFAVNDEITIPENLPLSTLVYQVEADDPEGDTPLVWSLITGDTPFTIDPDTGELTLTGILDVDTAPLYVLTITVEDSLANTTTITLTIHVVDEVYYFVGTDPFCCGLDDEFECYNTVQVLLDSEEGPLLAEFENNDPTEETYNSYPVPYIEPVDNANCPAVDPDPSFWVLNTAAAGNIITAITTATDYVFWIADTGTLPLDGPTGEITGTGVHVSVKVTVTAVDALNELRLYKNGILEETIPVPSSGAYIFTVVSFVSTDKMRIEFAIT